MSIWTKWLNWAKVNRDKYPRELDGSTQYLGKVWNFDLKVRMMESTRWA